MKQEGGMMGGNGSPVEADEPTSAARKRPGIAASARGSAAAGAKKWFFRLVDRKSGKVRSHHMPSVSADNLRPILNAQLDTAKTRFMTDGEGQYRVLAPMFQSHEIVNHTGGEYVRGDVTTNTVEGFFSILKRGIIGTFHHNVSPQHLQRYCAELDFRYREGKEKINDHWVKVGLNDTERAHALLIGAKGKRLTYATTH